MLRLAPGALLPQGQALTAPTLDQPAAGVALPQLRFAVTAGCRPTLDPPVHPRSGARAASQPRQVQSTVPWAQRSSQRWGLGHGQRQGRSSPPASFVPRPMAGRLQEFTNSGAAPREGINTSEPLNLQGTKPQGSGRGGRREAEHGGSRQPYAQLETCLDVLPRRSPCFIKRGFGVLSSPKSSPFSGQENKGLYTTQSVTRNDEH